MTEITPPAAGAVTLFTTPWCGYCRSLKQALTAADVTYTEVDIEQDPGAADYVMSVNNGNQTVPTVLFPDGSVLTNPSLKQVRAGLTG